MSVASIMLGPSEFRPGDVFSVEVGETKNIPRVLIAPSRYVQGVDVLDHLARYLSIIPSRCPVIMISSGGKRRFGDRLTRSMNAAGVDPFFVAADGECCDEEIERLCAELVAGGSGGMDCLIAIGGGKCIDTGKCVAHRLGLPVVVCPTIASNDAPCSAVSVVYTKEGVFKRPEMFANSPALVVVDTRIVVDAPVRQFVAGIGDAMATWYEARASGRCASARSHLGARPTSTALALSQFCADSLFAHGPKAVQDVATRCVTEEVEIVVEANTLLSGLGFESGGLGVAHGIASALTVIPHVDEKFFHGEMVAIGTLVHLAIENDWQEIERVADLFVRVGLPIDLGQISLDPARYESALGDVAEAAMNFPFVSNVEKDISTAELMQALFDVHQFGSGFSGKHGSEAYLNLHDAG